MLQGREAERERERERRIPHLRCQELWSATERGRPTAIPHVLLAQSEVCNLYESVSVQEKVVQLQIPAWGEE